MPFLLVPCDFEYIFPVWRSNLYNIISGTGINHRFWDGNFFFRLLVLIFLNLRHFLLGRFINDNLRRYRSGGFGITFC